MAGRTSDLMDAATFARLSEGAILVDPGRGVLVDGKVGALVAGLHVFLSRPGGILELAKLKNMLLPHISLATAESRDAKDSRP